MKEQIALYKKWRKVLQQGTFYRGRSFYDGTQSGMGGSVLADEAGNQWNGPAYRKMAPKQWVC